MKQSILKKYLSYNETTGVFTWLVSRKWSIKVGDVAGSNDALGYHRIGLLGGNYLAHKLAWLYVYGEWPAMDIDHINRKKDDNRIKNLRLVTNQENHRNRGMQKRNTSGVTGVCFHKVSGLWHAQIGVDMTTKSLGYFRDKKEAILARKQAEQELNFA